MMKKKQEKEQLKGARGGDLNSADTVQEAVNCALALIEGGADHSSTLQAMANRIQEITGPTTADTITLPTLIP